MKSKMIAKSLYHFATIIATLSYSTDVQARPSTQNGTSSLSVFNDPQTLTERVLPFLFELWSLRDSDNFHLEPAASTAEKRESRTKEAPFHQENTSKGVSQQPHREKVENSLAKLPLEKGNNSTQGLSQTNKNRESQRQVNHRYRISSPAFRSSFGHRSNSFNGKQSNKKRPLQPAHRSQYTETFFQPLSDTFKNTKHTNKSKYHIQMWSPVSNFEIYDRAQERSLKRGVQDFPDLLSSAALVSVDKRIIDVIEAYPIDCSQKILCRIGSGLVESSPLQALMLFAFESNVFGYRDVKSKEAIHAALNGEDCRRIYRACPGNLV